MSSNTPRFLRLWSWPMPYPLSIALPGSSTVYRMTSAVKLFDNAQSRAGSSRHMTLVPKIQNMTRLPSSFSLRQEPTRPWQFTTKNDTSASELEPQQLLTNWNPTSRPYLMSLLLVFQRRLQQPKLLCRPLQILLPNLQNNLPS